MKIINDTKLAYDSEYGKAQLVQMLIDGKFFEEITSTQELAIHNYLVKKMKEIGFLPQNFKKIIELVMREEIEITESEREKVAKAFFEGKTPSNK